MAKETYCCATFYILFYKRKKNLLARLRLGALVPLLELSAQILVLSAEARCQRQKRPITGAKEA